MKIIKTQNEKCSKNVKKYEYLKKIQTINKNMTTFKYVFLGAEFKNAILLVFPVWGYQS